MDEESGRRAMHEVRLRVRYAETDQMGVVYHANYLVWMEIGRVELVRSLGCDYKEVEENAGLYLAVMEANCRYLRPARYDDEIVVRTEVLQSSSRMIQFGYEIHLANRDCILVEASTKHVWLNKEWRPARLPDHYRSRLAPNGKAGRGA